MRPELTEGARDFIANRYAEMRCRQDERTLPVTARTLETVIRLASAHAKARLSHVVEAEPDCEVAMDILSFALYHEHSNQNTSNAPELPVAVSDQSDISEADEPATKRQRLDETEEEEEAAQEEVDDDLLKSRVISEILSLIHISEPTRPY